MTDGKRRAYRDKAEAEMRLWNARVEELIARAEAKKAAGKVEYYETLEKLQDRRDAMVERLGELKETTSDAWDEVKAGFEKANGEISEAFHKAREQFGDDADDVDPDATTEPHTLPQVGTGDDRPARA